MDGGFEKVIHLLKTKIEHDTARLCESLEKLNNPETDYTERRDIIKEIRREFRELLRDKDLRYNGIYIAWIEALYKIIRHHADAFEEHIRSGLGGYLYQILLTLRDARGTPGLDSNFSSKVNQRYDEYMIQEVKINDLEIKKHCQSLRSSLLFIDCAGKPAILSELFRNKAWNPLELCFNSLILIEVVNHYSKKRNDIANHRGWFEDVRRFCTQADKKLYQEIRSKASNAGERFLFNTDYSRPVNLSIKDKQRDIHSLASGLKAYCNSLSEDEKEYLKTRLYEPDRWFNYPKLATEDFVIGEGWNEEDEHPFDRRFFAILSSEPGCGKTIALMQYCYRKADLTERKINEKLESLNRGLRGEFRDSWIEESYYLRENKEDVVEIPIYVSAKHLAKQIQLQRAQRPRGELIEGKSSPEALVILAQENSLPKMRKSNLWDIETRIDDMRIFVDAFDECSGDEKEAIIEFVKISGLCSFIFTVRSQELDSLTEPLTKIEDADIMYARFDYSKEELNEIMPTKLALAWGQNEDIMQWGFDHYLEQYEPVLTHPVFVGLFCRLMSEGKLDVQVFSNHPFKDESLGNYTGKHIQFYQYVIDIGLSMLIRKRHKITTQEADKYKRAFGLIAWYYTYESMDNFDEIYAHLQIYHGVEFEPYQREILKHDLTLLYAAGERVKDIHLQVFETAVGQILCSEPELRQRMNSTYFDHDVDGTVFLSYIFERGKQTEEKFEDLKLKTMVELGTPAAKVILREELSTPLFLDLTPRLAYKLEGSDTFHEKVINKYISYYEHEGKIPFDLPMYTFSKLPGGSLAFVHRNVQKLKPSKMGSLFRNFPDIHPSEWSPHEEIHAVEAYTEFIISKYDGSDSERATQRFHEYRKLGLKILQNGDVPSQEVLVHLIGDTTEIELNLDKEFLNLVSLTTDIDLTDIGALEIFIKPNSFGLTEIVDHNIVQKILQNSLEKLKKTLLRLVLNPSKVKILRGKHLHIFLKEVKNRDAFIKFLIHRAPAEDLILTRTIKVVQTMESNGMIPARCNNCGSHDSFFELDHILPVKYGGRSELGNLAFSCTNCNRKGSFKTFSNKVKTGKTSIKGFKSEDGLSNDLDLGSFGKDDYV